MITHSPKPVVPKWIQGNGFCQAEYASPIPHFDTHGIFGIVAECMKKAGVVYNGPCFISIGKNLICDIDRKKFVGTDHLVWRGKTLPMRTVDGNIIRVTLFSFEEDRPRWGQKTRWINEDDQTTIIVRIDQRDSSLCAFRYEKGDVDDWNFCQLDALKEIGFQMVNKIIDEDEHGK